MDSQEGRNGREAILEIYLDRRAVVTSDWLFSLSRDSHELQWRYDTNLGAILNPTITIVDADLVTRELPIEFVGDFCDFSADFDCDGDVDETDFLAWQTGFASFTGDAQRGNGDANGDGVVDGDDFLLWQAQFGSGGGAASVVPEPSGMLLVLWAALGFCFTARRRPG